MPPKRKAANEAEDDLLVVGTKKLKPHDPNSARGTVLPYKISIALRSKFDVFPTLLRGYLQTAFHKDLYTQQHGLFTNALRSPHQQIYQLLKAHRVRSTSLTFSRELLTSNIPSLPLANAALMEYLLSEKQPDLREEEVTFSHTATQEGLQNPEFLELYPVRMGEVGWGIDEEGALSFYYTKAEGKCLGELVWYVVKGEIKVEEEA